jgi:hypothetical protein
MLIPVRTFLLTGLMLLTHGPRGSASIQADTTGLEFLGFRAGARLDVLDARVRQLGGRPMRCYESKLDRRVADCRGSFREPGLGSRSIELWISAIDGAAGVITISGRVQPEQLTRWRAGLEGRYGAVGPRVQGPQYMLQWVRAGRMLRLTWRMDRLGKVASVSLVDGKVLDDWGRSRVTRAPRPSPARSGR